MTKPLVQSSTVQNAIAGFVVLVLSTLVSAKDPETGELRMPSDAELALLVTGGITLYGTIQGRKRAVEPIGKPTADTFEPVVYPYTPPTHTELLATTNLKPEIYPQEPDFNYISTLPSAEDTEEVIVTTSFLGDEPPVFEDAIDNDEEDLPIKLSELTGKYYVVAKQDTKLKISPDQSSELSTKEYIEVAKGQKVFVDYWKFLKEQNNHIEVGIDEHKDIHNGVFYVYAPHFDLYNVLGARVEIEVPTSPVTLIKKNLTPISLPGNSSPFYLENPIYPGSHFTWAEATKNGQRIPATARVVDNIIKQARELDKLRAYLGNKSLVITSWYRDPRTNAAVGGASNSAHLTGLATDILCPSMSIYKLQDKILSYWKAGGVGKGAPKGFVHIASDGWYRIWNY